jgi:3-oxoacyl-ACP reductase-like protein
MDSLTEIVIAIIGGVASVALFRFFKPDVKKQNNEVLVKVDKLEKENTQLEQKIEENKTHADQQVDALEEEKNKDLTAEGLADFFDKRK